MKWEDIKGRERPSQPWIKDAYLFGLSVSICQKHRKTWKEGATFKEGACKKCIEKVLDENISHKS